MAVETIGEAWQLGWRITSRRAFGNNDGMRSIRSCIYQYDLDLKTLIWTRGAAYPLSNLATRLKCPSCGSRSVALVFHMPDEPQTMKSAGMRGLSSASGKVYFMLVIYQCGAYRVPKKVLVPTNLLKLHPVP